MPSTVPDHHHHAHPRRSAVLGGGGGVGRARLLLMAVVVAGLCTVFAATRLDAQQLAPTPPPSSAVRLDDDAPTGVVIKGTSGEGVNVVQVSPSSPRATTAFSSSSGAEQSSTHRRMDNNDDEVVVATAVLRAATTKQQKETGGGGGLLKAVILFLYGGRWHGYFVRECLPRLDAFLLRCYPYPVHIFHEGISTEARASIEAAVPHAPRVHYEDVGWVWKKLPEGVTEDKLGRWMKEGVQHKFQKRGYRVMCRFWAGIAWTLQSMDRYDYYLRLDTDSIITRPVLVDPFRHVFVDRGCEYGFNRLKGENPYVATGLDTALKKWTASAVDRGVLAQDAADRVHRFATNATTGKFWAPMYYNNFEMGTFALKRSAVYMDFFKFVDRNEPYGIFKYRWGDAPLHTLGVVAAVELGKHCNVTQETVGYRHAAKRPGTMQPASQLPTCRATAAAITTEEDQG